VKLPSCSKSYVWLERLDDQQDYFAGARAGELGRLRAAFEKSDDSRSAFFGCI